MQLARTLHHLLEIRRNRTGCCQLNTCFTKTRYLVRMCELRIRSQLHVELLEYFKFLKPDFFFSGRAAVLRRHIRCHSFASSHRAFPENLIYRKQYDHA